jgi:Kef-type K+ transport system membrane component KefB
MVLIFSLFLLAGLMGGQLLDVSSLHGWLEFGTAVCLAYIMIEVGLEFSVGEKKVTGYGSDALFAFGAAVLPAILWYVYFAAVVHEAGSPSLIAGLSAAPTSAGILFAMMLAAGLGGTWVFQKARTLAVLDDLVTVLLLCPLQIIVRGFEIQSLASVVLIGFFIFASFCWRNRIQWPVGEFRVLIYGLALTGLVFLVRQTTHVHLDVLIPAFMLGCLIRGVKNNGPDVKAPLQLDTLIKAAFMLLVGFSFPKIDLGTMPWPTTLMHVIVLTILANLGKSFLLACYCREASIKERLALSVAMFPRGEVGAAVLLIGVGYGLGGYASTLAMLSLALNLVLTGGFIWIVIRLVGPTALPAEKI